MSRQTVSTLRQGRLRETNSFHRLIWKFDQILCYLEDRDRKSAEFEMQDRQIADLLQDINFGQPPAEVWERIKLSAEQFRLECV